MLRKNRINCLFEVSGIRFRVLGLKIKKIHYFFFKFQFWEIEKLIDNI
ncbi:hypothetical protein GM3709_2965 [Geminocystis sp. NIES-3709]|nr:hypothetical protein GM3709_2965 [Geminocystis sp. NIES-3709]